MNADWSTPAESARRYRLAMAQSPMRGRSGDHLARGVGSSVEFQDFREYQPGDDPRRIDWAALARTDQIIVRLHRADLQLSFDLLLDGSRSMGLGNGDKPERLLQCAYLFVLLARRAGARVTVWNLAGEATRFREGWEQHLSSIPFDGDLPLPALLSRTPPRLAAGSVRILLSDFLFPHDPHRLASYLSQGASSFALLQFLTPEEREPRADGFVRFRDVETGEERQMRVGEDARAHYRKRIGAIQGGLSDAARSFQGIYALVDPTISIEEICRGTFLKAGVLVPA